MDELHRNDVNGAFAIWQDAVESNTLTPSLARDLLMMQDDAKPLMRLFSEACKNDPRTAAKVRAVSRTPWDPPVADLRAPRADEAGDWDEALHPRDADGKFGSGGASGSGEERAAAAFKDRAFIRANQDRISAASSESNARFPREKQGTDEVHEAAQHAIREEIQRIHKENDLIAGNAAAQAAANSVDRSRYNSETGRIEVISLAERHEKAMAAARAEHEVQLAEKAGGVPAAPDIHEVKIAQQVSAETSAQVDAIHEDLDAANKQALQALAETHALVGEMDEAILDKLPSTRNLLDELGGAANETSPHDADEHGERHQGYDVEGIEKEPIAPPDGVELDEDTHEPKEWEPDMLSIPQEDILSFEEDKHGDWDHNKIEKWTPAKYIDNSAEDYPHLEFDDDGKPYLYDEDEDTSTEAEHDADLKRYEHDAAEHKAAYETAAKEYKAALATHKAEYETKVATYNAAVEQRHADIKAKALEAQTHLETLHAKQINALATMKALDDKETVSTDKATEALSAHGEDNDARVRAQPAFQNKEYDEKEDTFADPATDRLYEASLRAYDQKVVDAQAALEGRARASEDVQDALKSANKETASAIKELAKFTGRAASIGGKTAKKRSK